MSDQHSRSSSSPPERSALRRFITATTCSILFKPFLPDLLMGFPEAEARLFNGVWVCMNCGARNRSVKGKPQKCRKCGSKRLRLKAKERRK